MCVSVYKTVANKRICAASTMSALNINLAPSIIPLTSWSSALFKEQIRGETFRWVKTKRYDARSIYFKKLTVLRKAYWVSEGGTQLYLAVSQALAPESVFFSIIISI